MSDEVTCDEKRSIVEAGIDAGTHALALCWRPNWDGFALEAVRFLTDEEAKKFIRPIVYSVDYPDNKILTELNLYDIKFILKDKKASEYIMPGSHISVFFINRQEWAALDAANEAKLVAKQLAEAAEKASYQPENASLAILCSGHSPEYPAEIERRIASAEPSTRTKLRGGNMVVEFDENGWTATPLDDDYGPWGYLHVYEESATAITVDCRDQIIRYFYKHDLKLPGIGATPQVLYFRGLSREQLEAIGNDGKPGFYA